MKLKWYIFCSVMPTTFKPTSLCLFQYNDHSMILVHIICTDYELNISVLLERRIPVYSTDQGKCPYCEKYFQGNLRRHIKGVHLKVKPFKCEYCDSRFSQKSDRVKHVRRIHSHGAGALFKQCWIRTYIYMKIYLFFQDAEDCVSQIWS